MRFWKLLSPARIMEKHPLLKSEEGVLVSLYDETTSRQKVLLFSLMFLTVFAFGVVMLEYSNFVSPEGKVVQQVVSVSTTPEPPVHLNTSIVQSFIPPMKRLRISYIVDKLKKLSYCVIPKNMSTLLNNIMCMLIAPQYFKGKIAKTKADRTCNNVTAVVSKFERIVPGYDDPTEWKHFTFVRNPTERFLSAYLMVCVKVKNGCFNCDKKDMECVLKGLRDELNFWLENRNITSMDVQVEMVHFSPQTWQCDFFENLDKVELIDYSPMNPKGAFKSLHKILKDVNVDAGFLTKIEDELLHSETQHTTKHLPERKMYEDMLKQKKIRDMLMHVYYYDYVLLGYPLP